MKIKLFLKKKEIENRYVLFGMLISMFAGFTWAYLHYGLGVPWI